MRLYLLGMTRVVPKRKGAGQKKLGAGGPLLSTPGDTFVPPGETRVFPKRTGAKKKQGQAAQTPSIVVALDVGMELTLFSTCLSEGKLTDNTNFYLNPSSRPNTLNILSLVVNSNFLIYLI